MVTAELAVAIPCLALVVALCVSTIRLGIDLVAVTDASRVAARALARGDSPGSAFVLAQRAAPGADVTSAGSADEVVVTVRRAPPALLGRFGLSGASATARVPREGVALSPRVPP